VRRKENETLDRAQIDAIIERALVCRIALCDDSTPYILPVNFGYEGGCLYIHCALKGKKLDILKRNPMVCFEVDIDHALVVGATPCSHTFGSSLFRVGKSRERVKRQDSRRGTELFHHEGHEEHEGVKG
jgi:nitroimidazol reductase NimA-like FMN-containing flavoprotein (pyridoxamine 5'-phosphate oxidase superfamily)